MPFFRTRRQNETFRGKTSFCDELTLVIYTNVKNPFGKLDHLFIFNTLITAFLNCFTLDLCCVVDLQKCTKVFSKFQNIGMKLFFVTNYRTV